MSDQVKQTVKKVFEDLASALETGAMERRIKIGLTIDGSELGAQVMESAARVIQQKNSFDVVLIGETAAWTKDFEHISTENCEKSAYDKMEELLESGAIQGCVTLHYTFPIGVSTVGRVVTPAFGRPLFIATTTGTTSAVHNEAMVLNAVNGVIAAKTLGISQPTVGILNVEGAKTVERALTALKENGYDLSFGKSQRADGGVVLRGNDLLTGSVDVVVCDSLTGNILMKLFSSYSSGGTYETLGSGYGPGIGAQYEKNICIVSRASGAPVIEHALEYAYQLAKGNVQEVSKQEYQKAEQAKLREICEALRPAPAAAKEEITMPEKEVVTEEIFGIDVMELEAAVQVLWQGGVYAESGMGCTGPIVLVGADKKASAVHLLKGANYL